MNLNKEHEKHRTERPPRVGPRGDRDVPAPTGAQRPGSAQEPPGDVVVVTAQRRRQGRGERCGDVGSAACPSPRRRYRSLCPQGRGGSSVSGDSRGIAMRMPNGGEVRGDRDRAPPHSWRNGDAPTVLQCKFTETQGTSARTRVWDRGAPGRAKRGAVWSPSERRGGCPPRPSLLGGQGYVRGAVQAVLPGESQLPGTGREHRGHEGGSGAGPGPEEMLAAAPISAA